MTRFIYVPNLTLGMSGNTECIMLTSKDVLVHYVSVTTMTPDFDYQHQWLSSGCDLEIGYIIICKTLGQLVEDKN